MIYIGQKQMQISKKFYDRFLKGIQNGWEEDIPPIRLSLLGFEADGSLTKSIEERPEKQWPLARQQLKTLYLDSASKELVWDKPSTEGSITHFAEGLTDSSRGHLISLLLDLD